MADSCKTPLKPVDLAVSKCFDVIYGFITSTNNTGTNRMWIMDNSLQLKRKIDECNNNMAAHCIST